MASKKEYPIKPPAPYSMFQAMFNEQFPVDHKIDTRTEDKEEYRNKPKKERDKD